MTEKEFFRTIPPSWITSILLIVFNNKEVFREAVTTVKWLMGCQAQQGQNSGCGKHRTKNFVSQLFLAHTQNQQRHTTQKNQDSDRNAFANQAQKSGGSRCQSGINQAGQNVAARNVAKVTECH